MQTAARRLAFASSPASSSSSSPSKRVFIGLLQSNFRGWRKPYAASVASIPCKPQRGKRMPIKERRALVESFVDKYKARNAGRFPSPSLVKQEIGGSYYIIRQIVQELQYNSKLASLGKGIELLSKAEDTVQNSDAKEVPSISVGDEIDTVQNSDAKELPSISVGGEIDTVQKSDAKELPSISVGDEIDTVQNSDAKELPSISVGDEIDTVRNSDAKGLPYISIGDEINTVQNSDAKELPSISVGDEIDTVRNSDAKGLPYISIGDEIDTVQGSDAKGLPSIPVGDEINTVQNSDTKGFPSVSVGDEINTVESSDAKESPSISVEDKILKSNIEIKDESSVSLKLEMVAHTSQFPPGETLDGKTEMLTTDSSHDAPCGEVVQHKGDDKALESEEHQHPIDYQSSKQGDSPRATNLWSTLRSLADGIIGFWRKM